MNRILWVVQVLLALLFLFAGVMKLITPVEQMTKVVPLSGSFIHFIAVAEILGAFGLILPRWLGIRAGLTVVAAFCLLIIMIGAVNITLQTQPVSSAILPFVSGVLCVFVAYGRWRLVP